MSISMLIYIRHSASNATYFGTGDKFVKGDLENSEE